MGCMSAASALITPVMRDPSVKLDPLCLLTCRSTTRRQLRSVNSSWASLSLVLPKTITVMDDTLEQPKPSPNFDAISGERVEDHEQDASDDDDGGLDWTKLPCVPPFTGTYTRLCRIKRRLPYCSNTARPVIPKRGDKDFEPAHGGGSGLQRHNLERARSAMFDALRSTRAISRYVRCSLHYSLEPS
jgi:hypothetical protein